MNNQLYGHLIFELSHEGRCAYSLPKNRFGDYELQSYLRRATDAGEYRAIVDEIYNTLPMRDAARQEW